MAELAPVSWVELVRRLRKLGFDGPYEGGKHPYMIKGNAVLTIPKPHRREIGIALRNYPLTSRSYYTIV